MGGNRYFNKYNRFLIILMLNIVISRFFYQINNLLYQKATISKKTTTRYYDKCNSISWTIYL
jgi:hypothetical protein